MTTGSSTWTIGGWTSLVLLLGSTVSFVTSVSISTTGGKRNFMVEFAAGCLRETYSWMLFGLIVVSVSRTIYDMTNIGRIRRWRSAVPHFSNDALLRSDENFGLVSMMLAQSAGLMTIGLFQSRGDFIDSNGCGHVGHLCHYREELLVLTRVCNHMLDLKICCLDFRNTIASSLSGGAGGAIRPMYDL
ncbi:hypothetical protein Tco_0583466 [Tanacetum coccineum]